MKIPGEDHVPPARIIGILQQPIELVQVELAYQWFMITATTTKNNVHHYLIHCSKNHKSFSQLLFMFTKFAYKMSRFIFPGNLAEDLFNSLSLAHRTLPISEIPIDLYMAPKGRGVIRKS
jgi:hypothetical protein